MDRSYSSNQSFFINQPISDEELSIPQQRFQNNREMLEALGIEIEKEMRRSQEIITEITQTSRPERGLIGASIVPLRDDKMSMEEKLARQCEEKRLMEKAVAARRRQYGG
ncbi:hypothetical protein RND71_042176 [Anisodus tanguticus]|uniref:Uncharacterized protein n=1 Tax=Anisodus tanguticus TaxID=243964 RepID=A0AAE1UUK0_9SOLA|nr:hypothetical protein RND71_042176 [Anisodus tanguticus]